MSEEKAEKSECVCQRAMGKIRGGCQYLQDAVQNAADHTAKISADDVEKYRLHSVAAYFGILFLIPLFLAKDSRFARFHTNQGILLTIVGVLTGLAVTIISAIVLPIPYLGILLYVIISLAAGAGILGLMIFGIYNVLHGYAKELPLIGQYRILADESAATNSPRDETAQISALNADTADLHSPAKDAE